MMAALTTFLAMDFVTRLAGTAISLTLIFVAIKFPRSNVGFITTIVAFIINTIVPDLIPFIDEVITLTIAISKLMGKNEIADEFNRTGTKTIKAREEMENNRGFVKPNERNKTIELEENEIGDIWEIKPDKNSK